MKQKNRKKGVQGEAHSSEGADLSNQTAGAHSCTGGIVGHFKECDGDGAKYSRGKSGRENNPGFSDDIGYLQHGGTQALGNQTADFVFTVAYDGKADHLAAAANRGSTCGKSVKLQHNGECGTGDGGGKDKPHHHRVNDAHEKGLHFGCGIDDTAKSGHQIIDQRAYCLCGKYTGKKSNGGSNDDIQLSLFGNSLAKLTSNGSGNKCAGRAAEAGVITPQNNTRGGAFNP